MDVGCGEGKYTILAQQMGFQAYGIDYIQRAIERAGEGGSAVIFTSDKECGGLDEQTFAGLILNNRKEKIK